MRIGFAGVANSHAFSDAASARESGSHELALWDPDDRARSRTFAREFDPTVFHSLDAFLAFEPDLVIVTVRPARTSRVVRRVLESGAGCFVNKVAAIDHDGIDALGEAIRGHENHFLTSSVLRFAPGVQAARSFIDQRRAKSVSITIRHDIGDFLEPERRWQDDPLSGGGTAISLGYHAWELLSAVVGGQPRIQSAHRGARGRDTASEETARFEGIVGPDTRLSVEIDGRPGEESYDMSVVTENGTATIALGGSDPRSTLGYRECFAAAVTLTNAQASPVSWQESAAVLHTTVDAARIARGQAHPQAERTTP